MIDVIKQLIDNLNITKQYCYRGMQEGGLPYNIFRSINYKIDGVDAYVIGSNFADWNLEYFEDDSLLKKVFDHQIEVKKLSFDPNLSTNDEQGKILAFKYNETLICGGSQQCSESFIDNYNFAPIDTWIWIGKMGNEDILLAWIPDEYINYAQQGIDCNPEWCIEWLDKWYPNFYERLKTT